MKNLFPSTSVSDGAEALNLMQRALSLIDALEGAGVIGAHLDLAISLLGQTLAKEQLAYGTVDDVLSVFAGSPASS